MLNAIGEQYRSEGNRFMIVTSTPALVVTLKRMKQWRLARYGRVSAQGKTSGVSDMGVARNRITASFELIEKQ